MRKALTFTAAAAILAGGGLAATPASAACPTDPGCTATTLTAVTVGTGTLSILAAAPVSVVAGVTDPVATLSAPTTNSTSGVTTSSGSLPLTTVTDTRLTSTGWTSTASAGEFTLVGGTATIPASAAAFSASGASATIGNPALTVTGTATGTGSATLVVAAVPGGSTTIGVNAVVYTPALRLTIPNGTASGVYTGTVTQSVS